MAELRNIVFGYNPNKLIFDGLSLSIPDGSRICFSAPSGKGKTTLLRLFLGLEKPFSGSVDIPPQKTFSAVFQEDRLLPWKNVLQNAALFSDEETAASVLKRLGLGDSLTLMPSELSGGMKRRLALARALSHPFDILVLDEAFNGLDREIKAAAISAVDEIASGKTILMVAHDLSEAESLGASVIAL